MLSLKGLLFGSVLLLVGFFPFTITYAVSSLQRSETVVLNKTETIDGDYFAAGETINLSGTVNGDAYLAAGNIIVDGVITGDLIVAGGTVNIGGRVDGDIRAAGGQINLTGTVGKNATLLGGSITASSPGNIAGSLVLAGGSSSILTPVGKDITASAGQLVIGNTVGGGINAGVEQLMLTSNAAVGGDVIYWSQKAAQVAPEATVSGRIVQNMPPKTTVDREEAAKGFGALAQIYNFVSLATLLVIGLLLTTLLPRFITQAAGTLHQRPWLSLGVGLLTVILVPVIILILLITLVGIPLALILTATLWLLSYVAKVIVLSWIGEKVLGLAGWSTSAIRVFVVGFIVYVALNFIPLIGGLISLLVIIFGLGALLIEQKNFYLNLRDKKLI